jgi:hypothetical protein
MEAIILVGLFTQQVLKHLIKESVVTLLAMATYHQGLNNLVVFSQLLTNQIALQHQILHKVQHITREHKTLQVCHIHQLHYTPKIQKQGINKILQFHQVQFQQGVPYQPYFKGSSYLNELHSMTQS